jgi:hypothetical protein
VHAWQQRATPARLAEDGLGGGQALGVLFEPLDAEELRPDGRFEGLGGELEGRRRAGHRARVTQLDDYAAETAFRGSVKFSVARPHQRTLDNRRFITSSLP